MKAAAASIRVKIFSESQFTVKGHGVHSAFVDIAEALREAPDVDLISGSVRRANVTHLHTVGPISLLLLWRSKRSVVTAHITAESLADSLMGGKRLAHLWRRYLTWFYNRADIVLALNDDQEGVLRRAGVRTDIVVVSPMVRPQTLPSRASARALLGIRESEQVVLSVGQVQPRKAVAEFHRTAAELPDVRFIWVGGFPFGLLTARYWEMRRLIRKCPDNVTHVGQLPRNDVFPYYAAADIYLHPSHQENAPVAVLEAAAAGLPLVLRDISCYRQLYPNHYLTGTDGSFGGQVQRLLSEPNLHQAMSDRARTLIDSHSMRRSSRELAAVYKMARDAV